MKLAEAVELYLIQDRLRLRGGWKPDYRNYGLRRFLKRCRRKSLDRVTRVDIDEFASWLQRARVRGRPYSSSVRSEWLGDLRRFLAWCCAQKLVLADLSGWVPSVRVEKRLPRVPSVEEVGRLLSWPPEDTPLGLRRRGLWELAYGTGLRLGELLALDLAALDLGAGWLEVREAKNGRSRLVPLGEASAAAVKAWLEARPCFWTEQAGEALWVGVKGKRLASAVVVEEMSRASRALGFRVTMHALRHAYATHLLRAGAPVRAVQELLGHLCLNSTQRYTRVAVDDLRSMLGRCHPRGRRMQ